MQLCIYLDKNSLSKLDDFAKRKGLSRSAATRFCILTYFESNRKEI